MEIPVNKNSLASALTALGKLVSRTSLIKAYQGIEIEGKSNLLSFRTRNMTEEIEFLLFADLEDDYLRLSWSSSSSVLRSATARTKR